MLCNTRHYILGAHTVRIFDVDTRLIDEKNNLRSDEFVLAEERRNVVSLLHHRLLESVSQIFVRNVGARDILLFESERQETFGETRHQFSKTHSDLMILQ